MRAACLLDQAGKPRSAGAGGVSEAWRLACRRLCRHKKAAAALKAAIEEAEKYGGHPPTVAEAR